MKEPRKGDSLIVAHARRELELSGAFKKTEDYDGFMGPAILALVKTFDSWSKGNSAKMQILHQAFNTLVAGELLAPPTDDPEEWQRINREDGKDVLRNLRSPFYVSIDGGKSWRNTATGETGRSRDHITGEDPKEEPENVKRTTNIGEAIAASDTEGAQAENTSASDGSDDRTVEEPAGNEGSSEATPDAEGRSVDSGVAPESAEAPSQPEEGQAKSEKREA